MCVCVCDCVSWVCLYVGMSGYVLSKCKQLAEDRSRDREKEIQVKREREREKEIVTTS